MIFFRGTFIAALLLTLGMPPVFAAQLGDPAAGQRKSVECQQCHGAKGISLDPTIPKLAGQYREYIAKQISEFQMETRRDDRMSAAATKITKTKDLLDIAAYFAALPEMKGKSTKSANLSLGRTIYENGLPQRGVDPCTICHGEAGKGNAVQNPSFPKIGGQHKEYLLKQMNEFRAHKRNTDPTGIMSNIGRALTAQELDAVVEYVSTL